MKSPFTGKEMKLVKEPVAIEYQGVMVTIDYYSYLCEDSGEHFTTAEMDDLNLKQVRADYAKLMKNKDDDV